MLSININYCINQNVNCDKFKQSLYNKSEFKQNNQISFQANPNAGNMGRVYRKALELFRIKSPLSVDKNTIQIPSFTLRQSCLKEIFGCEIRRKLYDNDPHVHQIYDLSGISIQEALMRKIKQELAKRLGFKSIEEMDEYCQGLVVGNDFKKLDAYSKNIASPCEEKIERKLANRVGKFLGIPREHRATLTWMDYQKYLMRGYFVEPAKPARRSLDVALDYSYFPHDTITRPL